MNVLVLTGRGQKRRRGGNVNTVGKRQSGLTSPAPVAASQGINAAEAEAVAGAIVAARTRATLCCLPNSFVKKMEEWIPLSKLKIRLFSGIGNGSVAT